MKSCIKYSKRVQAVLKKAKRDFDEIYDVYEGRDFVEINGSFCGDLRCYRYYDNGMVAER